MLKSFLALTFGLGLVVGSHASAQDNWEAGKNYFLIEPPQATTTGDKIEVVEVFSYACPHCNDFWKSAALRCCSRAAKEAPRKRC